MQRFNASPLSTTGSRRAEVRRGDAVTALWRAGLLTAVTDGLFATVLNVFVYRSVSFSRLWQNVASVPFGKQVFQGGALGTALGLIVHCCVAFFWTALFLFLVQRLRWLSALVVSRYGVVTVASVYGPFVWMMMSLVAIPLVLHRAPTITANWWVLLIGHVPFVGLPIVATTERWLRERGPSVATTSRAV